MSSTCPLCNSFTNNVLVARKRKYYHCNNCQGIFIDPDLLLNKQQEKARYELHNNDVANEGYQKFVEPLTTAVLTDFTPHHSGLDFGAGTGSVVSKMLTDNGFQIKQYDPFFHNFAELLAQKYNYIACCEVVEHFYNPLSEFLLLKNLLQANGRLYCYTSIYNNTIDFANWHYTSDPTHVFFYRAETLIWIKENVCFSAIDIDNRLIVFTL